MKAQYKRHGNIFYKAMGTSVQIVDLYKREVLLQKYSDFFQKYLAFDCVLDIDPDEYRYALLQCAQKGRGRGIDLEIEPSNSLP